MAPHFACELWAGFLGAQNRINTSTCLFDWDKNVLDQKWPIVDVDFELDLIVLVTELVFKWIIYFSKIICFMFTGQRKNVRKCKNFARRIK